jgi:hypothetical protein
MLTAEDNSAHTMRPRLFAAGADLERVMILNRIHKDNKERMFLLQEDIDVLEEILRNDPEIGLVTWAFGGMGNHREGDAGALGKVLERRKLRTHIGGAVAVELATHVGSDRIEADEDFNNDDQRRR